MHPILFKCSFVTLYSYGFCVALAMLFSLGYSYRRSLKLGLSPNFPLDILFIAFVAGIAGARIFYVWQNWDFFRSDLLAAFRLQEGGLVWYGGFLFAMTFSILYVRAKKGSVLFWADFFAPAIAAAHGIGRVGCFMNGCCYGKAHHPVQLYESAGLWVLAFLLYKASVKKTDPGRIFGLYLFGYGSLRFCLEFLRDDQALFLFLTLPQWISLALILSSSLFLRKQYKNNEK